MEPEADLDDLTLRIQRVGASPLEGDESGALTILIETTRGEITGILHPVEGGTTALICVGGALGGIDGPADRMYARLPAVLREARITVLRLEYRMANHFDECVADVLAGCAFLRALGASDLLLLGHSFGAAVVIRAGELHDGVRGVAALSPQLFGTRSVQRLGKPLLLVHGTADTILLHAASEDIYDRAEDPKRIVLFEGLGHSLWDERDQVMGVVVEWLTAVLAGGRMPMGREERAHESESRK